MIDCRLDEILEMLRSGILLGEEFWSSSDIDNAVRVREICYDGMKRYDFANGESELNNRWQILPIHRDLRELRECIRVEAYKIAHAHVSRFDDHRFELSDHIQREFDWIAKSRALDFENSFIDSLWSAYKQHRIPMPPWVGLPV